MNSLLLLLLICGFNQAGDLEAYICHADEPRREPHYINEGALCFGLRKTLEQGSDVKKTSLLSKDDNDISESAENEQKITAKTKGILIRSFEKRSPYVLDPRNDNVSDEDIQKQVELQLSLKNQFSSQKKVQ